MKRQLTVAEAAKKLGVTGDTIRRYIAYRRLRGVKVRGVFIIQASDVEKFRRPERGPKKGEWGDTNVSRGAI